MMCFCGWHIEMGWGCTLLVWDLEMHEGLSLQHTVRRTALQCMFSLGCGVLRQLEIWSLWIRVLAGDPVVFQCREDVVWAQKGATKLHEGAPKTAGNKWFLNNSCWINASSLKWNRNILPLFIPYWLENICPWHRLIFEQLHWINRRVNAFLEAPEYFVNCSFSRGIPLQCLRFNFLFWGVEAHSTQCQLDIMSWSCQWDYRSWLDSGV